MYDVLIVGAGPAGLTAALYASRRNLKTLVVSKDLGGQAVLTDKIYNYPGVSFTAGLPLMKVMKQQAQEFGSEFIFDQVEHIQNNEKSFTIRTSQKTYQAKTVILSFGLTPRDLCVANEDRFKGTSVVSEVLTHSKDIRGKDVAVVGGGSSAFEAARDLSAEANHVYLIHRREGFRAEDVTVQEVKSFNNVSFILNTVVNGVEGQEKLKGLSLKHVQTEEVSFLPVEKVFVKIGYRAYTEWLGDLVQIDERKHIKISKDCETKTPGLFAAGDCTTVPYKQIVTSGGEGCKAALKAYAYLMEREGKRPILIDWT